MVADAAFGDRRAILIDLPGSGYSDKPQAYGYSTSQQAQVVIELIAHLQLPRLWLYGHSMGGGIAIEAADRLGSQICGLAVSEPNLRAGGGAFSRGIAAQPEAEILATGFAALLEAETPPWAGCLQVTAPWAVWRAATSLVNGVTPDWQTRLQGFTFPVRLLVGEWDAQDAEFAAPAQQGIETVLIANAGHSMAWGNPHGLAQALAAFCHPK